MLLVGGNFLIEEKVHRDIKQYAISGMQYYPSTYVDDGGKSYENYWFMTFYQSLDCWCRINSKKLNWKQYYDSEVEKNPSIVKYSLDENVLDAIQEENRLMFKMGGTSVAYIFFHKKIVDYFISNAYSGVRFLKVSSFREGDQFD